MLGSMKARSGPPASLWSREGREPGRRESQEPGSSYLGPAEKEQVKERRSCGLPRAVGDISL